MEAPTPLQSAADEQEDVSITRREYDDEEDVMVVDFGRGTEAKLDVIDGLAIVVAGDRQFEFEIPDEATEVTTNDGMLIIKE